MEIFVGTSYIFNMLIFTELLKHTAFVRIRTLS